MLIVFIKKGRSLYCVIRELLIGELVMISRTKTIGVLLEAFIKKNVGISRTIFHSSYLREDHNDSQDPDSNSDIGREDRKRQRSNHGARSKDLFEEDDLEDMDEDEIVVDGENRFAKQEREFREWKEDLKKRVTSDVPKLQKTCTKWMIPTPDRVIRIKYVERMRDPLLPEDMESPMDRKVVAEFKLQDMIDHGINHEHDLSSKEKESIRKRCLLLVGKRYHVAQDIIRISVDECDTREANHRLVHQRIAELMKAAMDDSLDVESIPWEIINKRTDHYMPTKYTFPAKWIDQAILLRQNMVKEKASHQVLVSDTKQNQHEEVADKVPSSSNSISV
jgi:hypothetical protein